MSFECTRLESCYTAGPHVWMVCVTGTLDKQSVLLLDAAQPATKLVLPPVSSDSRGVVVSWCPSGQTVCVFRPNAQVLVRLPPSVPAPTVFPLDTNVSTELPYTWSPDGNFNGILERNDSRAVAVFGLDGKCTKTYVLDGLLHVKWIGPHQFLALQSIANDLHVRVVTGDTIGTANLLAPTVTPRAIRWGEDGTRLALQNAKTNRLMLFARNSSTHAFRQLPVDARVAFPGHMRLLWTRQGQLLVGSDTEEEKNKTNTCLLEDGRLVGSLTGRVDPTMAKHGDATGGIVTSTDTDMYVWDECGRLLASEPHPPSSYYRPVRYRWGGQGVHLLEHVWSLGNPYENENVRLLGVDPLACQVRIRTPGGIPSVSSSSILQVFCPNPNPAK